MQRYGLMMHLYENPLTEELHHLSTWVKIHIHTYSTYIYRHTYISIYIVFRTNFMVFFQSMSSISV